jgi:hypothetical protein
MQPAKFPRLAHRAFPVSAVGVACSCRIAEVGMRTRQNFCATISSQARTLSMALWIWSL